MGPSGADPIGHGGGCPHHQPSAHAVALRADFLGLVHLLLRVEEGDKGHGVFFRCARGVDGAHQRRKLAHIGRIREKIEVDFKNPKLLTNVWGVGYRFEGVRR